MEGQTDIYKHKKMAAWPVQ